MTSARFAAPLFLLIAMASPAVHAEAASPFSKGWYAGAAGGRVDSDYRTGGNDGQDGQIFAVHGGYRFSRHLAIEAGYADQGGKLYVYDCPVGYVCDHAYWPEVYQRSLRRADVSLVATIPLGERFDLFARVGHSVTRFDQRYARGANLMIDRSDDLPDELFGIGGRWHFHPRWSLRLQFDRMERRHFAVHSQWVGVEYRFGR